MKHVYLVVEGPHDPAFIGKLLARSGLSVVRKLSELDAFWTRLVPEKFPYKDDLLRRVPVPTFYADGTRSVAVDTAEGEARLVETVEESLDQLGSVDGVGVILDADSKRPPGERRGAIEGRLASVLALCPPPAPASGVLVMPDNINPGTLEDVLIDCARENYLSLHGFAEEYVSKAVDAEGLDGSDLERIRKPAGRNKALVGAISAVLRPGRAIQVSIANDRWLDGAALELDRVSAVVRFLRGLGAIDGAPGS